jgi:hypothetical protein
MLLAKIIAGMNLGLVPEENLLQLLDEVLQVLVGKFPAEPKHQTCYLAHGGEPLGNPASSLKGGIGKRDSTAFFVSRQPRSRNSPPSPSAASHFRWQINLSSPGLGGLKGGESKTACLAKAVQQISGLRKESF